MIPKKKRMCLVCVLGLIVYTDYSHLVELYSLKTDTKTPLTIVYGSYMYSALQVGCSAGIGSRHPVDETARFPSIQPNLIKH